MFFLLLSLQDATAPATATREPPRFSECMDLATGDPSAGQAAASAFEDAAREAEAGHDAHSANY